MLLSDFITEAKVPSVKDQILADVQKYGGTTNQYFVRFTDTDHIGFNQNRAFAKHPDLDNPKYDVNFIGNSGRPALWFYPLTHYLKFPHQMLYAGDKPYVWLVKLKPDAWLQPVVTGNEKIKEPPPGKDRVGLFRISPTAAIFFKHGYDVVGKYYDYASQHKRHGEVKGIPEPTFFDRIRGHK